ILIFTIAKPLQSFVSRKEIREPRDLKGKKVAGSSPGGSATILAYQALKHFALEPGKDVQVLPMGGIGRRAASGIRTGRRRCRITLGAGEYYRREQRLQRADFFGRRREFPAKWLRHFGGAHPTAAG
ncbi:MAG: ABC transporter substrate-binding protein, partial [Candidatus Binatia bacterium]